MNDIGSSKRKLFLKVFISTASEINKVAGHEVNNQKPIIVIYSKNKPLELKVSFTIHAKHELFRVTLTKYV